MEVHCQSMAFHMLVLTVPGQRALMATRA
jgi:hypothetical protein